MAKPRSKTRGEVPGIELLPNHGRHFFQTGGPRTIDSDKHSSSSDEVYIFMVREVTQSRIVYVYPQ
jgi:hypothetical protein